MPTSTASRVTNHQMHRKGDNDRYTAATFIKSELMCTQRNLVIMPVIHLIIMLCKRASLWLNSSHPKHSLSAYKPQADLYCSKRLKQFMVDRPSQYRHILEWIARCEQDNDQMSLSVCLHGKGGDRMGWNRCLQTGLENTC